MANYSNQLREGEVYAGPGITEEKRLENNLSYLYELLKIIFIVPKVLEVIKHNQALLNETGPKRTGENKNDRRRKWLQSKGIKS